MWGRILESFAETFGVTRRVRPVVFTLVVGVSALLLTLSFAEGGPRGIVALIFLLAVFVGASLQVLRARAALWKAATEKLGPWTDAPLRDPDLPPTALALHSLARAVSQARHGAFVDAGRTLDTVDRDKLRPDEERLFAATRAMVALGLGDTRLAAKEAAKALPTKSEEIDLALGRVLITDAWTNAERLRAIDSAWAAEGVPRGTKDPLPRLRAIVRLRVETEALDAIETWEAKELADEARAVGDEALAADLEARVRPAAYR